MKRSSCHRSRAVQVLAVVVLAIASACSDSVTDVDSSPKPGSHPEVVVETVFEGLVGPTQFAVVDDSTFVMATINGGENDRRGQVVRIDTESGDVEILRDGLDKPTGLALLDGELWVMERDTLSRGPLDGEPTVVVEGLPNNGRSEGTLTVTPDGLILFDTSGSKRGSDVVEGSGRLFTVDPAEQPGTPTEIASGFKHAYAHVYDGAGVLWSTEMSDGAFDGEPAADELVAVLTGADHGWPWCVGNNRPVAEFGGDADRCASVPPSEAVFAPGATPTSVAVSPFAPDTLLVALWNEGRIVAIDTTGDDPAAFDDVVTGLARPQHLVASGDAVYVTEFGEGRLLRLTGAEAGGG